MEHFSVGLLIGRFQPFHYGHKYLIEQALSFCDKIVIGIGSANKHGKDNPFSYAERKRMVSLFLEKEEIGDKVLKIFPSPDIPDDNAWLKDVLGKAGKFDVVVGDNEWVNNIFEKAGYTVLRIGHFKRNLYEGEKIRELFDRDAGWKDRIPSYIHDIIKKD